MLLQAARLHGCASAYVQHGFSVRPPTRRWKSRGGRREPVLHLLVSQTDGRKKGGQTILRLNESPQAALPAHGPAGMLEAALFEASQVWRALRLTGALPGAGRTVALSF